MKFLFLTQYFPPEVGASQARLGSVARELVRAGHSVEVVTALPNYPQGEIFPGYRGHFYRRETWHGIRVHRVWAYPATGAGLRRILNYLSFMFTCMFGLARAGRRATGGKPDYVFIESPPLFLAVPGCAAARFWRAMMIFNVADLWPDSVRSIGALPRAGLLLRAAGALENWAYRRASFVNAITGSVRRDLRERKHVPNSKLLFLPNGVDTELFRPSAPDRDLLDSLGLRGKQIFLYIGTHGYVSGLDFVVRAAKLLESDRSIHILLVGDGADKSRIVSLARDLHLANVTFLDPVPLQEVPRYLSIARAGLITARNFSVCEGARPAKTFPIMAAGKPVVLAHHGEIAALVRRAQAGLIVPPENPEELAAAIQTLARDQALCASLGRNGRAFAERNFRWRDLVDRWLAALTHASPAIRDSFPAENFTVTPEEPELPIPLPPAVPLIRQERVPSR